MRLEVPRQSATSSTLTFQFHKGAIRTYRDVEVYKGLYLFQFHKGAIRTVSCALLASERAYFNSIKVRLEQMSAFRSWCVQQFQFHKGAIRTDEGIVFIDDITAFQFHKGAIRTSTQVLLAYDK